MLSPRRKDRGRRVTVVEQRNACPARPAPAGAITGTANSPTARPCLRVRKVLASSGGGGLASRSDNAADGRSPTGSTKLSPNAAETSNDRSGQAGRNRTHCPSGPSGSQASRSTGRTPRRRREGRVAVGRSRGPRGRALGPGHPHPSAKVATHRPCARESAARSSSRPIRAPRRPRARARSTAPARVERAEPGSSTRAAASAAPTSDG